MARTRIAVVCFEGGSTMSTAGPLEVFGHALARLRRSGNDPDTPPVAIITPDGAPVTNGGYATIRPTTTIEAVGRPDLVFLAGTDGGEVDGALRRDRAIGDWLVALHKEGVAIAAVCPSQALLAEAGLLDGRSAGVHWSLLDAFRARWPEVAWSAERLVVRDDGLYTSCGASSALDLALYLVDRLLGRETMLGCARWLLTDLPRVRQNVPPPLFATHRPLDPGMEPVEAWLQAHFREPLHLEELAARFGMAWRTFHWRFHEAFGEPPKAYLQKLRLAAARHLLETETIPVDLVAHRVGYEDTAFFRALFKRHAGMTPSEYRETFRFRSMAETRAEEPNHGAL